MTRVCRTAKEVADAVKNKVAGGVGVMNMLRDKYKIVEKNDKYITIKRK